MLDTFSSVNLVIINEMSRLSVKRYVDQIFIVAPMEQIVIVISKEFAGSIHL